MDSPAVRFGDNGTLRPALDTVDTAERDPKFVHLRPFNMAVEIRDSSGRSDSFCSRFNSTGDQLMTEEVRKNNTRSTCHFFLILYHS